MVFVENTSPKERSTHKVKSTTKITNLKTEFSMKNATNFAGGKVILVFLETIGLSQSLQTLGLAKAVNAIFPTQRILLYLIIGWMMGCERLFHSRNASTPSSVLTQVDHFSSRRPFPRKYAHIRMPLKNRFVNPSPDRQSKHVHT